MKSLSTLIKLQKTHVDEQRQHLARLQERLDYIEGKIAEVEIRKAREQAVAERDAESTQTYGAYLYAAVAMGRALEKERQIAALAVKAAHDRLSELFEEQKRYEVAEQQRLDAEMHEERRRETIELDEIGGVMHERQK